MTLIKRTVILCLLLAMFLCLFGCRKEDALQTAVPEPAVIPQPLAQAETEPAEEPTVAATEAPAVTTEPTCPETEPLRLTKIHTHDYTGYVTAQASCTDEGEKTYVCSCGNQYTEVIPKTAHSYEEAVVAPTCTEAGFTVHTCADCGDSYRDTSVSATGHVYASWPEEKELSSTGNVTKVCTLCQAMLKPEHTHTYTAVVTAPTCTEDGYTTYTCTCGDSYTADPVASTGHSYMHIVTKPTCTADGYTTHTCSKCKESYTDTVVPSTGHNWSNWQTVIAPTDNATGLARKVCFSCGNAETKVLEMVNHTHNFKTTVDYLAPTCKTEGYETKVCICGETQTEVLPREHTWVKKHKDEVGHYDVRIVCHCGWSCSADIDYTIAFLEHVESVDPETRYDHSYYDTSTWVVDIPAVDWEECSECGVTKE